jgi:hypothetical protein
MQKNKQAYIGYRTRINFPGPMMFEIGIVKNPQVTPLVNIPASGK